LHFSFNEGREAKSEDKHEGGMMEESDVHRNMAETLEQLGGDETLLQELYPSNA
jgi:hypothetical protein